ncbi:MAG: hypothetical protein H7279_05965 [Microbacteriaceae bacterium]|nr:hypothetical protein [Microbacteriaceae bacterium]
MGFLDRLLGREEEPSDRRPTSAAHRSDDEIAVERYEYLLRTAPPKTIEKVHTEAFSKLTPEQRDILFDKLTANVDSQERPADAEPATLAKAATRAEFQQPGTLTRTLGGSAFGGAGGPGLGGMFASSLLGSVAGFVIGSALVSSFMPMDSGDNVSDAGADASGTDAGASGASDAGGWGGGGYDSGGDFGGGDFGGF